ncbi:hypothetical protein [Octadecabacter sp. R77987]|uniref:hypothetical protein n=1 Tax=Octadecabacter sp. R77987 TaxID=3093874 RepID=UPI00366E95CC
MLRVFPFLFLAAPVLADCPPQGDTFLSCTILETGKQLEVCVDGGDALYAYGPAGQVPELAMRVSIRALDYRPWPGAGSTIWEEVSFERGDYFYVVFGGVSREPSETTDEIISTALGGFEVYVGESFVTRGACIPETVVFPWTDALSRGKRAAGLEWSLGGGWEWIGQN